MIFGQQVTMMSIAKMKIKNHIEFIYFIIFLFFIVENSIAQTARNFELSKRAKYEIGGGAFGVQWPNYPGARDSTFWLLPFPYVVYRGDVIRSDDEGTRAKLKASKYYEVGLSFGFKFPVKSSDNLTRNGMPNLDPVVSTGPQVLFRLVRDEKQKLNLRTGLRAALSVSSSFEFNPRGFVFFQALDYWRYLDSSKATTMIVGLKNDIANKKYNSYFYSVTPEYANSSRNSFEANAGVFQTNLYAGVIHSITSKLNIFAGANVSDFSLSKNKNSPLLETQTNFGYAFGFFWLFMESDEKINVFK
jgi:MipA family protein